MRIIIGCEESGHMREAFRARGHDAWSCDLKPARDGSPYHLQCDVLEVLDDRWGMAILHPECRYLCNSGAKHLYKGMKKENGIDPVRWAKMVEAANFFKRLLNANIPKIAVENSIMHGHAKKIIGIHQTQTVQPWWFGHKEMKSTCWWLKGLPKLVATDIVGPPPTDREEKKSWEKVHRMGPSEERSQLRATTYPGMAAACAEQWG